MDVYVLAGLVKRVYPKFDIKKFEYRFKLQKFVFLLRSYGLNLGYPFSLYIKGPYSPELARDAFQIEDWDKIQLRKFEDTQQEAQFENFMNFLQSKKDDEGWLECSSTILLLRESNPSSKKDELIGSLLHIKPKFSEQECIQVYEGLVKERLINDI